MALDYFAGCLGGCAGVMVGYPLDTIKVHMQTQDYRNPKYKGSWHCFRTILAKESVAGFYRGMSSPMAGVALVNAVVFGVYGHTQKQISDPDSLSSHFVAGAVAGIAQTPICSPIELAKTRMQLQASGAQYSGPVQCLKHIYKREGYRGVFKGLGITFLRETPSFGTYFLTYEVLVRTSERGPISTPYMLLAGGLAGTASWMVSYPLDVVKSRIQADNNRYAGMMDCLRQSVKTEGYSCLYRGLNSTILRAFPTNAVTFTVVTWTFRIWGQESNEVSKIHCKPKLIESVRDISEVNEPFLEKWNTFLTNASDSLLILRLRYSTLLMVSTGGLMLKDSTSCNASKWTKVRIKCSIGDQAENDSYDEGRGEKSRDVKRNINKESGEETVELTDVEQTIVKYGFSRPELVNISSLVSCF